MQFGSNGRNRLFGRMQFGSNGRRKSRIVSGTMDETTIVTYESNDEEPIGEGCGCEYADTATMVSRPVYPKTTVGLAIEETTSQTTAPCGANNRRALLDRYLKRKDKRNVIKTNKNSRNEQRCALRSMGSQSADG